MKDEAEQVRRAAAGDRAAFGPLVEAYQGLVFTYFRRQGADAELARDLLQETFTRALGSIGSLREPAAFKGWLMRIATNELLKNVRRRRETVADFSGEESQRLLSEADETMADKDPGELARTRFDAARALVGMQKLPDIYRQTLLLRFQAGLSYKEIAGTLGITLENAKFRIHHGLKLLRALVVK